MSGSWVTAEEAVEALPGVDLSDLPVLAANGVVRARVAPLYAGRRFTAAFCAYSLDDLEAYAARRAAELLSSARNL